MQKQPIMSADYRSVCNEAGRLECQQCEIKSLRQRTGYVAASAIWRPKPLALPVTNQTLDAKILPYSYSKKLTPWLHYELGRKQPRVGDGHDLLVVAIDLPRTYYDAKRMPCTPSVDLSLYLKLPAQTCPNTTTLLLMEHSTFSPFTE